MDLHQFQALIDAFGEDLAKWPSPAASDAKALLESSAEARAIRDEAVRLRGLLSRQTRAPAGLLERIVRTAEASMPPDRSHASPEPVSERGSGKSGS